jgi:hypothetical protein
MTSEKPEPLELLQRDAATARQSSGTVCMSGQALALALSVSPLHDVEFEPEPYYPPVRDVLLYAEDSSENQSKRGTRHAFFKFLDEAGDEPAIDGDELP